MNNKAFNVGSRSHKSKIEEDLDISKKGHSLYQF